MQALQTCPTLFTIREIIAGLPERFSAEVTRATVSNFVRRLESSAEIEVIERGQGRRPSLYRKKQNNQIQP